MKILVITDNEFIYNEFRKIIKEEIYKKFKFDFRYSYKNIFFKEKFKDNKIFLPLNIKESLKEIIENYDKIISLHCKQIFPEEIVKNIKCINVHPGYNPENRGWFPQVFSIINKKQTGVTIHKIDKELDHGEVLLREKVNIEDDDTSLTLYNRIQLKEIEMLKNNLENILIDKISGYKVEEGNINYFSDFKKLCELDLKERLTLGEAIDKLRALTHGEYKNAYFYNKKNEKIYVSLTLEKEVKNE